MFFLIKTVLSFFFVVNVFAFELSYLMKDGDNNKILDLDDLNPVESSQACVCVPYWQCKEDFSGLLDQSDLVDVRFLENSHVDQPSTLCSGDFDVCCKTECGRRHSELQFRRSNHFGKILLNYRILGEANDAEFAEFPWMLGILEQKVYRCGASLIHPQVAMTAAHCVTPDKTYKVRAGEWNWESQDEPFPHQDRWSKNIIIHPDYNYRSLKNDVALIILDKPFKIGKNVGIICVSRSSTNYDWERCIATGWGKNSFTKGSYQSTLKKVQLPIVGSNECTRQLQQAYLGPYFTLHKSFICAGGKENKDTCKGDGGGPLICPLKGNYERYLQVGIVSWGLTCGLKNTPGVYTNVALLSNWIDSQLQNNDFDRSVNSI